MKISLNKNKIELIFKTLSIILTIIYIIFIFWSRILREKIPKILYINYTEYQVLVFSFVFLICSFMLLYSLRKLFPEKQKGFLNKLLATQLGVFVFTYIINAHKHLYDFLYNYITIRPLIEKLGVKTWNSNFYETCLIIPIFMYMIRIFICLIFLLDIFYFNTFNYFYKSLILMLIPLIIKACIFIIHDMSKKNKEYIEKEFLIIEPEEFNNGFYMNIYPHLEDKLNDNQIKSLKVNWVAYLANCMFTDKIYDFDYKYTKYLDIFCYTLYVSGWGYLLYFWFFYTF